MKDYRIYSLDASGHICFAHMVHCEDDLSAMTEGERLADNYAVEVWDGARLVARVKRENMPMKAQEQRSL